MSKYIVTGMTNLINMVGNKVGEAKHVPESIRHAIIDYLALASENKYEIKYISESIQCAIINSLTLALENKYEEIYIYKLEENKKFNSIPALIYNKGSIRSDARCVSTILNVNDCENEIIMYYFENIKYIKNLEDANELNILITKLINKWWNFIPIAAQSLEPNEFSKFSIMRTEFNDGTFAAAISSMINANHLEENEVSAIAIVPYDVNIHSDFFNIYKYCHVIRDNDSIISSNNISRIAIAICEIENRFDLPDMVRDMVIKTFNGILDIIKEQIEKEINRDDEIH